MRTTYIDVHVRVQPRSSKRAIGVDENGEVRIWTRAAPADGKANEDVAKQLATAFGVPKSRVSLRKGKTSRRKTFRIDSPPGLPDWARHPDFS